MQPVSGENGKIGQDADADLFAYGLFDGGEVVAGEGNVGIFADLFGKPAGKTGVYGNLHETPVFAADGFQVAFCESVVLTPNTGSSHLQGIDIHRPSGRGKLPCQRGEGLLP